MNRSIRLAAFVVALLGLSQNSQAASLHYIASLNSLNEGDPNNNSPGTGTALVDIDTVAATMRVRVTFMDLTAGNTAAHIHAVTDLPFTGNAGVATTVPTFTDFPTGATSGTYDHLFDMTQASSYNPSFVTAHGGTTAQAFADLSAAIAEGKAYLNIHTSNFPGGEIRGFLQAVPEPASFGLLAVGALGLLGAYRWSRR